MGHPRARAGAAGRAWTRAWPRGREFSPSPTSACRAQGSVPGALATAAREPVDLQASRIPPWPPGSGGSHTGHRARLTTGHLTGGVTTTVTPPLWWPPGTGVKPGSRRSASVAGPQVEPGARRPGRSLQPHSLLGRVGLFPVPGTQFGSRTRRALPATPPAAAPAAALGAGVALVLVPVPAAAMVAAAAGVPAAAVAALVGAPVAALAAASPVRAAPASASRVPAALLDRHLERGLAPFCRALRRRAPRAHGNDLRAPGDNSQPGPPPTRGGRPVSTACALTCTSRASARGEC
jgi:hypothetical protein